ETGQARSPAPRVLLDQVGSGAAVAAGTVDRFADADRLQREAAPGGSAVTELAVGIAAPQPDQAAGGECTSSRSVSEDRDCSSEVVHPDGHCRADGGTDSQRVAAIAPGGDRPG